MFVEQNVFVKTPKSNTIDKASAMFICTPSVLNINVSNKVNEQYTITGIDIATEK